MQSQLQNEVEQIGLKLPLQSLRTSLVDTKKNFKTFAKMWE